MSHPGGLVGNTLKQPNKTSLKVSEHPPDVPLTPMKSLNGIVALHGNAGLFRVISIWTTYSGTWVTVTPMDKHRPFRVSSDQVV